MTDPRPCDVEPRDVESRPSPEPRDVRPGPRPSTTAPRWVKVFWIVGAVLALLVVAMLLAGGHGPGRHTWPHGASPASVTRSGAFDGHMATVAR